MGFLSSAESYLLRKAFDEINNEVDNINRGGCGFFAKHVHDCLVKKGFNPELVILVRGEDDVYDAMSHISNNRITDLFRTWWVHVMVKVDGRKPIYIDSHGYFTDIADHPTFNDCSIVDLPYDMLKRMLGSRYEKRWNCSFNRNDHKKIKKKLEKHLEISKGIRIFGLSL